MSAYVGSKVSEANNTFLSSVVCMMEELYTTVRFYQEGIKDDWVMRTLFVI